MHPNERKILEMFCQLAQYFPTILTHDRFCFYK